MSRSSYQYETSPRKYEPDYDIPRKRTQQTRRKNSTKKTTAKKQTIKTNYQIKKEKKKIIPASRIAPTASPVFFAALFVNLIFL